jgi:glycosyltransferase involved in cell wall biosynthesis
LQEKVSFLGFRNDVGDLLNASDIVVMPSGWEGLSIALLEAMCIGKPIVTTNIGSNLEVTESGKYAKLVNFRDVNGLVDAIQEIVENPEISVMLGKMASVHFNSKYTEQRMLNSYMTLYEELIQV